VSAGAPSDELIVESAEVVAIAEKAKRTGCVALDLEFVSEGRYVPDLALVQLGFAVEGDVVARAIDPQCTDIQPVLELLVDDAVTIVAHAARQDLSLLAAHFGVRAKTLIDTQIAAAFTGLGEQIGYARLAKEMVGVNLDKGPQWTDWAKRPLTERQLRYALDDVRYLLPSWQRLREKLESAGRMPWVVEESEVLAEISATRRAPEDAYRFVGGWNALRGNQLGALRGLAAWREREALETNKPPSWLLPDGAMVELCKKKNPGERDVRRARGVGAATVRKYGDAILAAIEQGSENPPPAEVNRVTLSPREQALVGVITGLIQSRCIDEQLPARFAGTRSDAEALVRFAERGDQGEEVALLSGWRKELIGGDALSWLQGKATLSCRKDSEGGVVVGPGPST